MTTKLRAWLTCYWPIMIVLVTLCLTIGMWYQRTLTIETNVQDMGRDITSLQVSMSAVERGVSENRDDTKMILEILLNSGAQTTARAYYEVNSACDTAPHLDLD